MFGPSSLEFGCLLRSDGGMSPWQPSTGAGTSGAFGPARNQELPRGLQVPAGTFEDRRAPRAPFRVRRASRPLFPPPRLRLLLGNLDDRAESGVAESPGQPRMEPAGGTLAVFLASTSMRVFQAAAALLLAPSFASLNSAPRSCCPLPLKRLPNASPRGFLSRPVAPQLATPPTPR